jgi:hypothetical protein
VTEHEHDDASGARRDTSDDTHLSGPESEGAPPKPVPSNDYFGGVNADAAASKEELVAKSAYRAESLEAYSRFILQLEMKLRELELTLNSQARTQERTLNASTRELEITTNASTRELEITTNASTRKLKLTLRFVASMFTGTIVALLTLAIILLDPNSTQIDLGTILPSLIVAFSGSAIGTAGVWKLLDFLAKRRNDGEQKSINLDKPSKDDPPHGGLEAA